MKQNQMKINNNNNMASVLGLFFFYCLIVVISSNLIVVEATNEFKVGEREGWREPDANNTEVYTQWASKNRFRVGDSLYFEYRQDSVLEVDKGGYYHCNTTKPIAAFNNERTTIKLDKPGPCYFISGAPDHCKNGQRLLINVMGLNPPRSPPSVAVPPRVQPSSVPDSPSPSPLSNSGFTVATAVTSSATILISTIAVLLV